MELAIVLLSIAVCAEGVCIVALLREVLSSDVAVKAPAPEVRMVQEAAPEVCVAPRAAKQEAPEKPVRVRVRSMTALLQQAEKEAAQ